MGAGVELPSDNPFFNEPEGEEPEAAETPEAEETDEESSDDELFEETESEEGEESEESDDDEDDELFEDEEDEDDGKSKTIPKTRFDQVIAERNEERKRVSELETKLVEATKLHGQVQEKYANFSNPVKAMIEDADFCEALEAINKVNPDLVRPIVAAVHDFQKTGEVRPVSDQKPETRDEPQDDPRLQKILERDARRTISEALPGNVRSSFRNVATDYILGTQDLEDLSPAQVKAAIREFIAEKGFTKEEVYASAAEQRRSAPPTGGKRGKAVAAERKADDPKGRQEEGPKYKNLQEWEDAKRARLRDFQSNLA